MIYGFDNDKYLKIQSEHNKVRIAKFGNKLYLELGGKLFDDHHASRVLPGFQPDIKLRMLSQLRDHAEIVIVISALDIEKNKVRQNHDRMGRMGITTYYHYTIEGYPNNVGLIASDEGFGNNDYIVTTRPLVIVTAPGPAAGRWQYALASFTTSTSAALKPDMRNLKHSPCGIFP